MIFIPKYLMNHFKKLKFKTKLFFSYALLISLPLILVTVIAHSTISRYIENQVKYSAKQAFELTHSFLSYRLNNIRIISDIIYFDSRLHEILVFQKDDYGHNIGVLNRDMNILIATLFNEIKTFEDIHHLRFYTDNDAITFDGNFYFLPAGDLQPHYISNLLEKREMVIWTAPELLSLPRQAPLQVISMIRGIRNPMRIHEFIGLMRLDIYEGAITEIISRTNMTDGSFTYIINSNGEIISQASVFAHNDLKIDRAILDGLVRDGISWATLSADNKKIFTGFSMIAGTDWMLVSVVPYRDIQAASISVRNQVLLVAILIMLAAYFAAYFITVSSMKRVKRLAATMQRVQYGDFNVIVESGVKDEVGGLEENFNYMVKTLSSMIAERVKSGQEKKAAELKALQAQINPHFLYNTLDYINWAALRSGVTSISDLVQSLANFYRLSLNKGKDIVPFRDEIAHVRSYFDIQNTRFGNKISFSHSVDGSILEYRVPKIILQPLVENSIIHGILENPEKTGSIHITGECKGDNIILSIKDDGVGMPAEVLKTILVKDNDGYGVFNVDQRIKLYYGNQYGLMYSSAPGQGTTVTISLPAHGAGLVEPGESCD